MFAGGIIERDGGFHLELDTTAAHFRRYGLLCAVADGMGGHNGGEVASQYALDRLAAIALRLPADGSGEDVAAAIRTNLLDTHQALNRLGALNPELAGMGTTIVGLYLSRQARVCFHAGDSRLYRLREGSLLQVTFDHAEPAMGAGKTGVITNALGGGPDLPCAPEFESALLFEPGDTFLLCSDGLSDVVSEYELTRVLSGRGALDLKAATLLDLALSAGARDNVTAVLVSMKEETSHG